MLPVFFEKIHAQAKAPSRAHETDVGWDLFSVEPVTIKKGNVLPVRTGIITAIPNECYGHICDRSGLGMKGLCVFGGIIDPGYRGEIIVLLGLVCTETTLSHYLPAGSKIAQLLVLPRYLGGMVEKKDLASEQTDRGAAGFGSTGV